MQWLRCKLSNAKPTRHHRFSRTNSMLISPSSSVFSRSRCFTASQVTLTSNQPALHILHKLRSDRHLKANNKFKLIRSSQPNCNNSSNKMQCHLLHTLFHLNNFLNLSTWSRLSHMPNKPSLSEWTPLLIQTLVQITTIKAIMVAAMRVTRPCHLTPFIQMPMWPAPVVVALLKACMYSSTLKAVE